MEVNISSICEKVFYINMNTSILRNKQSLENLSKLNLPVERVEAITPETYKKYALLNDIKHDIDTIPSINSSQPHIWNVHTKRSPRWKGDICCGMSHFKAIKTAIQQGHKRVMICEDDFVYLSEEAILFQKNIEKIPQDFDVIHITSLVHSNYNNAFRNNKFIDYSFKGKFINEFVFQVKYGLLGTGAYIINLDNKKWVNEFLECMENGAISDCVMSFNMQGKYKHYTTKYKLGYQDYLEPTTIASTKGKKVDPQSARIKWLKNVTFNTPWSIIKQRNKKMVARIKEGYENKEI